MQPPIMRPAPRIASGVFNVMEAFKTRPGTLLISSDPMVIAAFNSVCEGLRQGRHIESLSSALQILSDAEDQAFASPEGTAYLADRPSLRNLCISFRFPSQFP